MPEFMITGEKRHEARRIKFFARFNRKVAEGRLCDVIDSSLGYTLTYYHTADGDMYKEWVKEKRTKKDFRLKNDDDHRLWVRLPGEKSDEEVEPINLIFDETDKFNEVVKNFIIKGMREYSQCFITIMAYNLLLTHAGEVKILNLTDDRLGHLRIVRRERIDEWIEEYRKLYRNAVEEQETEGSGFVYIGWIGFHIEMFPLRTFVATSITHLLSLDRRRSTRISMTTDAYNGVSFWPVKADTRSSQIARLAMQPCTTSDGNNPTSTRYSE